MSELRQFRWVAMAEGLSFLVLVLVAMPLKYLAGLPLAVRIVGMVHGLLFVLFLYALLRASLARSWPVGRSLKAFISSLVPGGTFWFDATLREELSSEVAR
jgi:integral membrane protein